ncbi:protein kinase [Thermoleophilia bacterium SCSIO 60948]|nr:protein kinase [Thermoleophilia bacterium SCSIO 60948]
MQGSPSGEIAGLELGPEIGRGGMGVVFRAYDPNLDRQRAIKLLSAERSSDPDFRERFRRESRLAASIEHPSVVSVLAAGETSDGRLFLVMRLVEGPSLRAVLAGEGRLSPQRGAAILFELGAALDAAHDAGLIHRDVKPANVLLEESGQGERAFLCDFGISKLADASGDLTETGQFLGSVDYVAPEQIRGEHVDRRADVYSLACVTFHVLTGEPPFGGREQLATMFAHASAERPAATERAPGLPAGIDEVLRRGMAINPGERHASASEFAADAASVLAGAAEHETAPMRSQRRGLGVARPDAADATAATRRFSVVRDGRRAGAVAGVVLALVAIGVSIAIGIGGDPASEGDPSVVSREPTATIDVPPAPVALASGTGRTWVVSPKPQSRSISVIDADADSPSEEIFLGGEPVAVAIGFGSTWVADRANNELIQIAPATGEIEQRIDVGSQPVDIAIGDRAIWVANRGDDTVTRLEPEGSVTDTIRVGPLPAALTIEDGDVWVANQGGGSVSRIDAARRRLLGNPIDVGQSPNDLASDEGAVWVSDNFGGTVTRISTRSEEPAEPIEVGAKPRGLRAAGDQVWVASRDAGTVTEIDTATSDAEVFEAGTKPNDLGLAPNELWVANFGDSTVSAYER